MASELKMMEMELNDGRLLLPKREGPMIIEEIHEDITQLPISKDNSSHLQPSGRDQELQESSGNAEKGTGYVHFAKDTSGHVQILCKDQVLQEALATMHKIHEDATQVQIQECFTTSHVQNNSRDQDYLQTNLCASDLRSMSPTALQTSNGECPEKQHKAVQERLRGNEYFKSRQYVEAIDCYSESLELDRTVAATYTNRALCHLRVVVPCFNVACLTLSAKRIFLILFLLMAA